MSVVRDFSVSTVVAGFVAVLVGYASAAVLIFQAAQALGASSAEIASWMWALGIGMGVTSIGLSLYYRMPVITAWSTPGAALIIGSGAGLSMGEATGAFIISAVLMVVTGFSGIFERSMKRVPVSLASAMLAGVLLKFGMNAFVAMKTQLVMVGSMFVLYLLLRRLMPRYAVVGTLLLGIGIAAAQHQLSFADVHLTLAVPIFTAPIFNWHALALAVPLYIVTMASQNIPGAAVMRQTGFNTPLSPTIGWIGVVNTVLAPFGGYAINLAAITAAICMSEEAHADRRRRYTAAVASGSFNILMGLFGATLASLLLAFPHELVLGIAGLALLGTIANGLTQAVREEREREAAIITFLVTASGLSLWGIGAGFWGLVAGLVALMISHFRLMRRVLA